VYRTSKKVHLYFHGLWTFRISKFSVLGRLTDSFIYNVLLFIRVVHLGLSSPGTCLTFLYKIIKAKIVANFAQVVLHISDVLSFTDD